MGGAWRGETRCEEKSGPGPRPALRVRHARPRDASALGDSPAGPALGQDHVCRGDDLQRETRRGLS
eukprot:2443328-Alexandrium_andersonii.AAC.1